MTELSVDSSKEVRRARQEDFISNHLKSGSNLASSPVLVKLLKRIPIVYWPRGRELIEILSNFQVAMTSLSRMKCAFDRAFRMVESLVVLALLHGYKSSNMLDDQIQIGRLIIRLMHADRVLGGMTKAFKYMLCSFFSSANKQELPERSDTCFGKPGNIFGGRLGRFFKCKTRCTQFCMDVLVGVKKGQKSLPVEEQVQSLEKHSQRLAMCRDQEIPQDVLDCIDIVAHEVRLYRTSKSIPVGSYTLSSGSCLESNRSQGGFFGFSRDHAAQEGLQDRRIGLIYGEDSYVSQHVHTKHVSSVDQYRNVALMNSFETESHLQWMIRQCVRKGLIPDQYAELIALPRVEANIIPEPLKTRVITKGEFGAYSLVQPFQKYLHRTLSKHPVFCLTSEEITEQHGAAILSGYKPGDVFVSGDYEAATDNLDVRATHRAFRSFFRKDLPYKVEEYLLRTLDVCTVEYSNKARKINSNLPHSILQKNGQLMGSPLSFPLLCIINAACYLAAVRQHTGNKNLALFDLPVLINGDDICFRCEPEMVPIWESKISSVNLKKSIGKNYVSDSFFQINSAQFTCQTACVALGELDVASGTHLKFTKGINFSVFFNEKKGVNERDVGSTAELRDISNLSREAYKEYCKMPCLNWNVMTDTIRHHYHWDLQHRGLFGSLGFSPFVFTDDDKSSEKAYDALYSQSLSWWLSKQLPKYDTTAPILIAEELPLEIVESRSIRIELSQLKEKLIKEFQTQEWPQIVSSVKPDTLRRLASSSPCVPVALPLVYKKPKIEITKIDEDFEDARTVLLQYLELSVDNTGVDGITLA